MANEKALPTKSRRYAAFHREIGELVFWFAGSENAIYMLAIGLIGNRSVSKVVMQQFHLEKAIDVVRKLAAAKHRGSPHLPIFDKALLRFKECSAARNALLHSVALPRTDPVTGAEMIEFISARHVHVLQKDRDHITQLRATLKTCSLDFMQAALDMGLFAGKRKSVGTAEQGVAADGASRRR